MLIVLRNFVFRQVKFRGSSSGTKRVAEEEIIEVEDLSAKQQKVDDTTSKTGSQLTIGTFKKPQINRNALGQKSSLANLVKRKTPSTATSTSTFLTSGTTKTATAAATTTSSIETVSKSPAAPKSASSTPNALSLLSGYDNNTDSDDSE